MCELLLSLLTKLIPRAAPRFLDCPTQFVPLDVPPHGRLARLDDVNLHAVDAYGNQLGVGAILYYVICLCYQTSINALHVCCYKTPGR